MTSREARPAGEPPLVEQFIPKEGLTLKVRQRDVTPTGFQLTHTEPSHEFQRLVREFYSELEPAFTGELVIKHCGVGEDTGFCKTGEVGQLTLEEEARVVERQQAVGMPAGMLAFARLEDEEVVELLPERLSGTEAVILMPKFPERSNIELIYEDGGVIPGSGEEGTIAQRLVRRLFAMKREAPDWEARYYGTMEYGKLLDLIIDDRMRAMATDPVFGEQARFVNAAVEQATSDRDFQEFLCSEVEAGRVGEQHGDPRFNNIFSVNGKTGPEPFIIDAVRLRKPQARQARVMYEWWITHDYLQLGLMLGEAAAASKAHFRGLADRVLEAYVEEFQADRLLVEDPRHRELLTLGWIYGLSVNSHVLQHLRAPLLERLAQKNPVGSGEKRGLEQEVAVIESHMSGLWEAMVNLTRNPTEGLEVNVS